MPLGAHAPPVRPVPLPAAVRIRILIIRIRIHQRLHQRCRHPALPLALCTEACAYAFVQVWKRAAWCAAYPALTVRGPCF